MGASGVVFFYEGLRLYISFVAHVVDGYLSMQVFGIFLPRSDFASCVNLSCDVLHSCLVTVNYICDSFISNSSTLRYSTLADCRRLAICS